ncbi:hypothetical protein ABT140_34365, partial [Streptomyces californicus]
CVLPFVGPAIPAGRRARHPRLHGWHPAPREGAGGRPAAGRIIVAAAHRAPAVFRGAVHALQ